MSQKKQQSFGRLLRYLFSHYKIQLIVTLICIVISAFSSSIATIFIQRLIDECITPGVNQGFEAIEGKFTSILLTMGFIYICGTIASIIYNQIMAIVTQGTLKSLRNDMFDKMQTLPVKYFDTHAHGDIMSTYTNDTDVIRQLIGQSLPTLFQSILTITVMFLTMLYYSIWLTLVVMIVIFLMLKITKKLGSITAAFMIQQQKSLAKEEGFIEEMMQGQKVIKVFCHEEENKEAFKKLNEQLFKDGEKANQNGNVLMPILGNVGNLMYVLLAVIGGLMVYLKAPNISLTGVSTVSIGIIVSFLGMSRQLSQTIGQASMQVSMIAMGLAGATRVFELMDEQPEEDHGYVTLVNVKKDSEGNLIETKENTEMWAWKHPHQDGTVTLTELTGDVRLEDVDFGYVPEKLVLNDVSLFAKPGQKIAFVGATGAGKTTITNLINRFYDIMEGKIRYDGINISKIKKPALRSSLGVVLQDVNLFTGSVIDNIRYGRLDATDEECIAAAKLTNADDFITRLPDGYETILTGNGSSLSQGQRQLISIARAAVADPPAMILDEATSSIDTRTEALVQAGMDNLMKGRTVFVIAHRLSTVKNSDAIMVLDHGKIIERGSHESLIEQKGTYYQLYTGAFELE
ncbi:MAG: ABC transporter ATP-binding protein [Sedimentibacter saalensis]|uniref:ABC transporter ATP-binding protein n=1 Tax=Sedimentibacter saalensis TaxID=130788 RepID=UPI002B2082E7|nr:ABC transporter ATP-binding protein [Sedimentibacter saalensis]MEA5095079.1 ABC transporter ATP-binding protein [Sedimentibacter saalensis]